MPRSELSERYDRLMGIVGQVLALTQEERDFVLDRVAPEPEPEAAQKPKRKPTIKCAHEGCGRALTNDVHDPDAGISGWHHFVAPTARRKSVRANDPPKPDETVTVEASKPQRCDVCANPPEHQDHDTRYLSSHPFALPKSAQDAKKRSSRKERSSEGDPSSAVSSEASSESALAAGSAGD